MKSLIICTAALSMLLVGSATPASAQANGRTDVSLSYSVLSDLDLERTFPIGWIAALTHRLTDTIAIVGEVGGNYDEVTVLGTDVNISVHSYQGGVRFIQRGAGRVRGFGQVLIGAGRLKAGVFGASAAKTGFAIQPGGGVDIELSPELALRIQGDYRAIVEDGTNNQIRVAGGIVYRFGR